MLTNQFHQTMNLCCSDMPCYGNRPNNPPEFRLAALSAFTGHAATTVCRCHEHAAPAAARAAEAGSMSSADARLTTDAARAVQVLRDGGLIGLPTETVYGLGADAGNAQAVARIFSTKQRPADHPLIVHIH